MAARKTEQEVREGLHVELQKHVQLLNLEFDKVERAVKHAYRMECDNEEIKELQKLKDTKMTMIRIRYHHETDLAVQEFRDKVEEVLSRNAKRYSNRADVGGSSNKQDGNGSDTRNRAEEDNVREIGVNQASKNTENKGLTLRTRSRKKVKVPRHEDIGAESAANIELSKKFLKSLANEPKNNSDNDGTTNRGGNAEKPNEQGRRLGKIIIKTARNRGVIVKDRAGSSAEHAQKNKSSFAQETMTRRNFTRNERFKVEQENVAQDTPAQKVKRRRIGKEGRNDPERPIEQENPPGNIQRVTNVDVEMLDAENVRSSEEDGGESNIPGGDENNAKTKKAVTTKSGVRNEQQLQGTPKRKRGRKLTTNKERAAPEEPVEETHSQRRKVTASGTRGRITRNLAPGSIQGARCSNTPATEGTEAEGNQPAREEDGARQEQEVEEVPVSNLRRSKRQRRPTEKVRSS